MKNYRMTEMIIFPISYMVISLFFFVLTGNGVSVWLGINVGFAMIPLIVITFIYMRMEKNEFKFDWISIILLLVFIFFFPNTFYVITDLIHIDQSEYYMNQMYQPTVYLRDIEGYIFIFHEMLTLLIGIFAGIKSLILFNEIFIKRNEVKGVRDLYLIILMFLSSIGIYIGRFLRFFSWDILQPINLVKEFYDSLDLFALYFVLLFTVIQVVLYYGYLIVFNQEPS